MALDLTELTEELNQTRLAVDAWTARQNAVAGGLKEMHTSWKFDQDGLETEAQEVSALQDTSTALRQQKDQVYAVVVALQDTLQAQEQQYSQKEAEAASQDSVHRKKLAALQRVLHMYSSRLGLTFKQGADELQLVMTQVQASQPARPFIVAVRVLPDNSYQVTQCEPHVESLPTLLTALNTSNNFSCFVKSLRLAWQQMVNPSTSA
ncbi:hypothetical protein QJQ45_012209 [Haematococcus lacustris]|nr:hypothetical protein QJQ45_012209 [Haematococcus lacustris]